MKAQQAYRDANSGMPPNIPNDIFKPSQPDDENDELSIFSGKTHTVNTTSTPTISLSGRSPQPTSSRGDSPQQILTDNPSFVGVHPSLISELSSFQPFIREQVQNAYRIGGDVFGGAPIVIDPIRRIPAGQTNLPAQSQLPLSVIVQQRSQQQPQFQQQQQQREQEQRQAILHQQELEQERFEQERRELERRQYELEKQEFARQKLLEYQRQQAQQEEMRKQQEIRLQELRRQQEAEHEAIRRHEAQEVHRRQQEKAQMQRQEQYRQQLEIQQLHFEQQQQQQHMVQYQHEVTLSQQQTMYTLGTSDVQDVAVSTTVPSQMPPPATNSMYATHNRHSQSSSSLRQMYQQLPVSQGTGQITPQQSGVSAQVIMPQHTGSQPQHTVPQTKNSAQQSSDFMDTTTGYVQPTTTSYGQSHPSSASAVPTSHFVPDAYKYWPAASTSFAIPLEQSGAIGGFAPTPLQPQPRYQHQQYSPDSALRGIAADDRSLQETWQSYMNKVWISVFPLLEYLVTEILNHIGWLSSSVFRGLSCRIQWYLFKNAPSGIQHLVPYTYLRLVSNFILNL